MAKTSGDCGQWAKHCISMCVHIYRDLTIFIATKASHLPLTNAGEQCSKVNMDEPWTPTTSSSACC